MRTALLLLLLPVLAEAKPRAVVIGDSHTVGTFGDALHSGLEAAGYEVVQFSVCGASVEWWLRGEKGLRCGYRLRGRPGLPDRDGMEERVRDRRGRLRLQRSPLPQDEARQALASAPDLVVVALGANEEDDLAGAGGELLRMIPRESRCAWVSPPPMPRKGCESYDRGNFEPILDRIVAAGRRPCMLVNSSGMINPARHSKCHFGACGTYWGKQAAARITNGAPPRRVDHCALPEPRP